MAKQKNTKSKSSKMTLDKCQLKTILTPTKNPTIAEKGKTESFGIAKMAIKIQTGIDDEAKQK